MHPSALIIFLLAFVHSITCFGPHSGYIPTVVNGKSHMYSCPPVCSMRTSAKECTQAYPPNETMYVSCIRRVPVLRMCAEGTVYNAEKFQCMTKTAAAPSPTIKASKLNEKLAGLKKQIEAFEEKISSVQHVIVESDKKIGLMGKYLIKALQSREQACAQKQTPEAGKQAAGGEAPKASADKNPESKIDLEQEDLAEELNAAAEMAESAAGSKQSDEEFGVGIGQPDDDKDAPDSPDGEVNPESRVLERWYHL